MSKTKKILHKAAQKFRKTEPGIYNKYSLAITCMANFIKKTTTPEVTARIKDDKTIEVYAND